MEDLTAYVEKFNGYKLQNLGEWRLWPDLYTRTSVKMEKNEWNWKLYHQNVQLIQSGILCKTHIIVWYIWYAAQLVSWCTHHGSIYQITMVKMFMEKAIYGTKEMKSTWLTQYEKMGPDTLEHRPSWHTSWIRF